MAFVPFNSTEITADKPVKQELWTKVKDNFDDHETRITSNENALQIFTPIQFVVKGAHYLVSPRTGIDFFFATQSITITNGRLWVIDAGTSGTTTIDVQVSRNTGSTFTSIFTVVPTLAFGAGSFANNSGTLDAGEVDINPADILRLDVSAFQVNSFEFQALLEFVAQ